MTTTQAELEKILRDGALLPLQFREFDITEVICRAKSKDKGKDKGKGKDGKKQTKAAGVETMPEPRQPDGEPIKDATKDTERDDELETTNQDEKSDDEKEADGDKDENGEGDAGEGSDEMEIAISSEYPVKRWYGTEILDHKPESVDMSRAQRGLAFLVEHDSREMIGRVENIHVKGSGEKAKMRGTIRFSKNARAREVKRDIKDKIRTSISVGYMADEAVLEKQSDKEGNTYRITRWTPLEVSSVAVPADPTVGHGRAIREGARMYPVHVIPASKPNNSEDSMPIEVKEERSAAAEIFRLGKRHNIDNEIILKMVEEGLTVADASTRILVEVEKRNGKPLAQPGSEQVERDVNLSEEEQREYNLARGILALAQNRELSESGSSRRINCFELEVSTQLERQWTRISHGGLFVPWSLRHAHTEELERKYPVLFRMHKERQTRAGLDSKSVGAGGALVFIEPGEFIQFLYNRMRVKELGARTLAGLRDNVAYPKQTGKVTGSWVGENPGVDVADSALTLAQIPSSPHTYQSSTSYSRQLLAQAVVDVDTLVREDLAMDMALSLDLAAIMGTGTLQPTGILNTTGVQTYDQAGAPNGWSPVWKDVVFMSKMLEEANADQLGAGAWLTTPGVKAMMKNTARLANTIALPIWLDDNTVDGYVGRSTNQVPKNGTMGTGTNLHTIIRGVFETMVISMWGNGFELVVDPYRLKKQGMIELTTFMLSDVTLKYPSAFVVSQHILVV